ncbi:hypothetical protein D1345_07145 [Chromobacterium rhizoryzae]|uniref:Uncharacterized protein n=1 Tax=Chromobacterium rhizoryzae TaxID=1778675 RepID=A0AAD0RP14_9NEIS|nr:hypothetical protein D1345_07145 [Chromobacterium rhizoryzae]
MSVSGPCGQGGVIPSIRPDALEPVHNLLRCGDTALKTASKCSCTTCTFRFLSRFRLVSPLLARF